MPNEVRYTTRSTCSGTQGLRSFLHALAGSPSRRFIRSKHDGVLPVPTTMDSVPRITSHEPDGSEGWDLDSSWHVSWAAPGCATSVAKFPYPFRSHSLSENNRLYSAHFRNYLATVTP